MNQRLEVSVFADRPLSSGESIQVVTDRNLPFVREVDLSKNQ